MIFNRFMNHHLLREGQKKNPEEVGGGEGGLPENDQKKMKSSYSTL